MPTNQQVMLGYLYRLFDVVANFSVDDPQFPAAFATYSETWTFIQKTYGLSDERITSEIYARRGREKDIANLLAFAERRQEGEGEQAQANSEFLARHREALIAAGVIKG